MKGFCRTDNGAVQRLKVPFAVFLLLMTYFKMYSLRKLCSAQYF